MFLPNNNLGGYYQQLLSLGSVAQSTPTGFCNCWNNNVWNPNFTMQAFSSPSILNPTVPMHPNLYEINSAYNVAFNTPDPNVFGVVPFNSLSSIPAFTNYNSVTPNYNTGMPFDNFLMQALALRSFDKHDHIDSDAPYQDIITDYYDEDKGEMIADIAENMAKDMNSDGWCATGVKKALVKAGIMEKYIKGDAYTVAGMLEGNDNFEEIYDVDKDDLADLPAGTVVVWGRSKDKKNGHVSISLGDGREASDKVRNQITDKNNKFSSCRVFIPV